MLLRMGCAALLAALAGCTTTAVQGGREQSIPPDRVFDASLLTASAERSARIVVTRDKGLRGSACSYLIFFDNVKLFALRPSETATLHVTPGAHFLRLETTGGLCGLSATSQNVVIAADERQVYRAIQPGVGEAYLSRSE